MSKYIVVTDRATAYAQIAQASMRTPVGLLRIGDSRAIPLEPGQQLGVIKHGTIETTAAVDKRLDYVLSVAGPCSWRSVELIYSLVCGYGLKLLIVDGIERMLHDPEAVAKFRADLTRIYDGAATCRCPLWIIAPPDLLGSNLMPFVPQLAANLAVSERNYLS